MCLHTSVSGVSLTKGTFVCPTCFRNVQVMKPAALRQMRNAFRIFIGKPEVKTLLLRPSLYDMMILKLVVVK
jgi:hypothetical protein